MASKRQLKKAIYRSCGEMAGECIIASETLAANKGSQEWDNVIVNIALVQSEAVNRVSVDYDKKPKDFSNGREYRKARRVFFKQVEQSIAAYMREQAQEIALSMNKLLPKQS